MLKSSLFVMPKIYTGKNENSLLKAVIVFIYAFFLYSIPLMKSNKPNTIDIINVALLISSFATIAITSFLLHFLTILLILKPLYSQNYTILIDFPSKQSHSFFHILNSIEQTINNYYCFPGTKGENSDKKGE